MKWLAFLLVNTAPVVCLTYLAAYFDKWWIVLFALLFGCSYKTSKKESENDKNS